RRPPRVRGLGVDIKSGGALEEERRLEEEERAAGREALASFPGLGAQMVDRLVEAGLYSPARIVRAGLEALEAVPGMGVTKAAAILKTGTEWVEGHPEAP